MFVFLCARLYVCIVVWSAARLIVVAANSFHVCERCVVCC